jgi:hypothetical protein
MDFTDGHSPQQPSIDAVSAAVYLSIYYYPLVLAGRRGRTQRRERHVYTFQFHADHATAVQNRQNAVVLEQDINRRLACPRPGMRGTTHQAHACTQNITIR